MQNFAEKSHICQSMYIFKHSKDLLKYLITNSGKNKSIGFVPTMGALHDGHIALIKEAKQKSDIVICSIFVNPTQFNDKKDFDKYPSTIEEDILKLENINTDILFLPNEQEIYPVGLGISRKFDFNNLDKVLEGKFRPGHFSGVAQVVSRLLDLVKPNNLYMGQKDYQQVLIIKQMLERYENHINLIMCTTVREKDGLAMSSRNTRLTKDNRKNAANIYKVLARAKKKIVDNNILAVKKEAIQDLEAIPNSKLEYIVFVDTESLLPIKNIEQESHLIICVAIFIGDVRLIDNVIV